MYWVIAPEWNEHIHAAHYEYVPDYYDTYLVLTQKKNGMLHFKESRALHVKFYKSGRDAEMGAYSFSIKNSVVVGLVFNYG